MDYGHTGNHPLNAPQDFGFTAGSGEFPDAETNENLNSNNWNAPNTAIFSENPAEIVQPTPSEAPHLVSESAINNALSNQEPNLGEIISVSAPAAPETPVKTYDEALIRAENDHIGRATLRAVENLSGSLKDSSPLSPFYEEVQQMRDDYLNNSFNRKRSA